MSHRMPVMERTRGPEFRRKCVPYYVQQPLRQPRHAPERAKIGTPDHFRLERPGDHAPAGSRRAIKGGGTAHAVRRRAAAAALIVFTGTGGLVFTVIPFTVVFLRTGKTGSSIPAAQEPTAGSEKETNFMTSQYTASSPPVAATCHRMDR